MRVGKYFLLPTRTDYFGHGNIIKYCNRPFLMDADRNALQDRNGSWSNEDRNDRRWNWRISKEAVDLMDQTLIDNINKYVGKDDILWHLGDFAFASGDYYKVCRSYRDRINCDHVNVVWGNHDEDEESNKSIRDLFDKAYGLKKIQVDFQEINVCHYALAVWQKSHHKAWNLYGHSHSNAEAWLNEHMPGRRSIDVGVDNAAKILGEYRPWSMDDLRKIMNSRSGFSMDHHGSKK